MNTEKILPDLTAKAPTLKDRTPFSPDLRHQAQSGINYFGSKISFDN
jgi:hypothetical protein